MLLALLNLFVKPVLHAQPNVPSAIPDRIIMNLTEETSTSVAVTWRTDESVKDGYCEIHPLTGSKIVPDSIKSVRALTTSVKYEFNGEPVVNANQHSIILNSLKSGGKYLYRVGSAAAWSEWFEFEMPQKSDKLSFIYFGDPQTDLKSQWSRVVRKAYETDPDCSFMLYGGDIINRGGRDVEWQEWFDAGSYIFATVPQALTPGNHDYTDQGIDPHWKFQFTQPQNGPSGVKGTCFFTDYTNLRIISIDSAVDDELEDENGPAMTNQKLWLDSVLANNDKKWVIVTTHLPFYSTNIKRDNPHIRRNFQPILEKYGVDLVLTGHDHAYGRGMVSDNPEVKPSIMYVVSVSGPKQYEAGAKNWMQKRGSNLQLFQRITIEGDKLNYQSFSADGALFDKFILKKNKKGNKLIELSN
jgi:hypothetical protein